MPTDYSSALARLRERERSLNAELADNAIAQQAIKAAMEHERCVLDNPRKSTRTVTALVIPGKDREQKPN